jgi:FlaA1/EpsC-like NDP-sugar epimerase
LEANEQAKGGEVFVLKMPIVRLSDLVEIMVEEIPVRYQLQGDIRIEEIGLRPGEKMDEQLMTADEHQKMVETDYMYIIPPIYGKVNLNYIRSASRNLERIGFVPNEIIMKDVLRDWLVNEELL